VPTDEGGTLPHPDQALPPGRGRRRPWAVVNHHQVDRPVGAADEQVGVRTGSVLHDVGQGLLHDPVGGQIHHGRQRLERALHPGLEAKPRLTCPGHQRVELGQRGSRLPAGPLLVCPSQDPEERAELRQRRPGGALDQRERLGALCRALLRGEPGRSCLDRDDAHVVRDDVVQLPGDAVAFGLGGPAGMVLPLSLEPGRPLLELGQVGLPGPSAVAEGPGHPGPDGRDRQMSERPCLAGRQHHGEGDEHSSQSAGAGDQADATVAVQGRRAHAE
jgi:hypothetical protein